MGAQRWTVALDGYLIPIGGGREREVYDDGEQVVLAADYDRDVAEAETRGRNAAISEALTWLERVDHYWLGVGSEGQDTMVKYWQLKPQIAALRKPEVEG